MGYAPSQVVEGQPRVGLPFGLFSVLSLRESSDPHWANGITWEAMTCDPVSAIDDPDCNTVITMHFADSSNTGVATAFTTYGSYLCGTPGGRTLEQGQESATAHLLAREEAQAEFQVWKRLATYPPTILGGGTALSVSQALATLENWLGGTYGSLGVIHAPRGAVEAMGKRYAQPSGSRLSTTIGTPVVAGSGYVSGTTPTGGSAASAGEAWVLASPALFGYRGQVFTSSDRPEDLLDTGHNNLYAVAERQYVVGFDPCGVAAVKMNLA